VLGLIVLEEAQQRLRLRAMADQVVVHKKDAADPGWRSASSSRPTCSRRFTRADARTSR